MDIGERLFGSFSNWYRARNGAANLAAAVQLEDELAAVNLFSQASASHTLILAGGGLGSVFPDVIHLPARINQFADAGLNRFLLLHKALVAGAVRRLQLYYPPGCASAYDKSFAIAAAIPRVQQELQREFPVYTDWVKPWLDCFAEELERGRLEDEDKAWLRFVRTGSASRNLERQVDRIPAFALAPWTELMQGMSKAPANGALRSNGPSSLPVTEKQNREGSAAEHVDLDSRKNQDNPVAHSFEKLETADEYKGGYRQVDGSDQLEEHSRALDELRLDKVTRGGESAASQYSADLAGTFEGRDADAENARDAACVLLPEWNYKTRSFRDRYCRLYTHSPAFAAGAANWIDGLSDKYAAEIAAWRPRLWSLVNQRRWQDRQWDGPDFHIDSVVRYLADTKHGGSADAKIYCREVTHERDFAALILIDQSLSTDSFVENRQVLGVELESVGLVGLLMGTLKEPVAIAGTFSETRNHCTFNLYKDFEDPWTRFYRAAPEIRPQGYTRLGPAIRHGTALLQRTPARQRLLIVLTDGRPTDHDRYEGRYGIEDIHHAFLEARQAGVQMQALAIESQARHYFPFLFGAGSYRILKNPAELPETLFRIFMDSRNGR